MKECIYGLHESIISVAIGIVKHRLVFEDALTERLPFEAADLQEVIIQYVSHDPL